MTSKSNPQPEQERQAYDEQRLVALIGEAGWAFWRAHRRLPASETETAEWMDRWRRERGGDDYEFYQRCSKPWEPPRSTDPAEYRAHRAQVNHMPIIRLQSEAVAAFVVRHGRKPVWRDAPPGPISDDQAWVYAWMQAHDPEREKGGDR